MYQSLTLFQTAEAVARHAGARQALTAQNVANADTPDYRAQMMPSFQDIADLPRPSTLRTTRPGHMAGDEARFAARVAEARSEPSPNGNGVSLEEEMLNAIEIGREHNRALTIYRHTMTVLRTTLGR